jgi:hypothetical protein
MRSFSSLLVSSTCPPCPEYVRKNRSPDLSALAAPRIASDTAWAVAARVKSSVLDENFCFFARVVNALGQPALSPAEIAVARAFCDQEKMRSELRYAVNVFCER